MSPSTDSRTGSSPTCRSGAARPGHTPAPARTALGTVSCREGRIPPPGAGAPLRLPGGQLLVVFTALAILTALAGLLPTRPATRISPTTALGGTE